MIDENALWTRAIDPMTARLEKQETFLAAFLKAIALVVLGAVLAFLIATL